MNKQKQIEEEVLKIGIKAKEASLKISSLSSQKKNDVLLDAADNIKKNKKLPVIRYLIIFLILFFNICWV